MQNFVASFYWRNKNVFNTQWSGTGVISLNYIYSSLSLSRSASVPFYYRLLLLLLLALFDAGKFISKCGSVVAPDWVLHGPWSLAGWTGSKLDKAGERERETTYRRKLPTCWACAVYMSIKGNRQVPVYMCGCVCVFLFCVYGCARVGFKLLFSLANQNKIAKYVDHFRAKIYEEPHSRVFNTFIKMV